MRGPSWVGTGAVALSVALAGCGSGGSNEKLPAPRDYAAGQAVSYVTNPQAVPGKRMKYRVSFRMPDSDTTLRLRFSRYSSQEAVRAIWSAVDGTTAEENAGALFTGPDVSAALRGGAAASYQGTDDVVDQGKGANGNVWVAAAGYGDGKGGGYLRVANPDVSAPNGAETVFYGIQIPIGPVSRQDAVRLAETLSLSR